MLTLTEIYLMKSYKYIRREWRNGRWRYWYDTVSPKERWYKGGFKGIHQGYWHNIRGAFDKLMKEQKGQVEDVFSIKLPFVYIDENTGNWVIAKDKSGKVVNQKVGVDLVWGNRKGDVGLDHIIDKHFQKYDHYHSIDDIVDAMDDSVKEMDSSSNVNVETCFVDEDGVNLDHPHFVVTTPNGNRMVIAVKKYDDGDGHIAVKHFILTSFVVDEDWMSRRNGASEKDRRIIQQRQRMNDPLPVE